jgi:deoxyribose-phosphate aldolase
MYIDYILNKTDENDTEARDGLVEALKTDAIDSITVPYHLIKIVKPFTQHISKNIELSCLVDYPLGLSDLKTRQFAVSQAIKNGATCVDVSMQQTLAANRKYDKIREDIKNIVDIGLDQNAKIRFVLEYRIFDHHCLKKICEIFENFNVQYIFPSSGYFIDNLADNIIASVFLHQNSKNLNIFCTGNIWTNKHFEMINKSGLFGLRINNVHSLRNFLQFSHTV